VDSRLDAELGRPVLDGIEHPLAEFLSRVLIGVRRTPALPEPAERAADRAHVGDVDVAIHDEGHQLARQLLAQLVRRDADVLDRLGPCLGEQGRRLGRRQGRPITGLLGRRRADVAANRERRDPAAPPRRGMKLQYRARMTSSTRGASQRGSMYAG